MSIYVTLAKDARPLYSDSVTTSGTAVIAGGYESVFNIRSWPHAAMTEEEVLTAAQGSANIPAAYGTFNVRRITIAERKAPFFYKVKVKWSGGGTSGGGVGTLIKRTYSSCDLTLHITQARSETVFGGGPSQSGLIKVTEEGAQGTDVSHGYLQMTEVHSKPNATMTTAYIKTLAGFLAEHYTNSDTFRGFDPGEVQIANIQIGEAAGSYTPVTFVFNLGKNLTGEAIPGTSITINKKAFDYVWTSNIKQKSMMNFWTETPQYAYVDVLYPSTAFATIVDA